jgi:hypothetical protein
MFRLRVPVLLEKRERTPVGATGVPAGSVSVTVTVQDEEVTTGVSQTTVVLVVRPSTVMAKAVLALLSWVESPP